MKLEALSLRRTSLLLGTALLTGIAGFAGAASAMTLQEAVGLVISTNPEVGVTIKDRRAIDYELRQARALYYPQIDIRLDAGIDFSENETTDTGNARTNQGDTITAALWPPRRPGDVAAHLRRLRDRL
jgi:adhesin transport system outer membrane protein